MDPVWKAVKCGRFLELEKMAKCEVWLGKFPDGQDLEVIIRKPKKPRSGAQDRYYYGVIVKMICEHTGEEDKDEIDYMLKSMFLCRVNKLGRTVVGSKSRELDSKTGEEYHERCRHWALNYLGLVIPKPNEVDLRD